MDNNFEFDRDKLIELAKECIYSQKHEEWEKTAKNLTNPALFGSVEIMNILSGASKTKIANKVVDKIKDTNLRTSIVNTVTNFSKYGPEFAIDRISKLNGGKVDPRSEAIRKLKYMMDENANFRYQEKKQKTDEVEKL